eukprot:6401988-Amphidinium_carterae.1
MTHYSDLGPNETGCENVTLSWEDWEPKEDQASASRATSWRPPDWFLNLHRLWGPLVHGWEVLPSLPSGKHHQVRPKGAAFSRDHLIHQFSRESETSLSHLYVCERCGGFAQCRWAALKVPCKGTPSAAGRTALRKIWRAEHPARPARGMDDTGWFWSQGPLDNPEVEEQALLL